MKRVLLSLLCCLPMLFSPSIGFSLELADENVGQIVSYKHYGPISDTETLWSISTKLRPDSSLSVQQTLVAIYKLNPFAFYDGNINKIIPESILKVPTLGFTQAQTNQEAIALISKYSTQKQLPETELNKQESPISAATKSISVSPEAQQLTLANLVDKEELILLENELETLRNEYDSVNQQLLATTQNNESLKLKLQPLNDQLLTLSDQLEKEILVNEKLQNLVNDYRSQLAKMAERPFTGDGLLNEFLRFITSSLTTLLIVIASPVLLLLAIYMGLTKLREKRDVDVDDQQESEFFESNASVIADNRRLTSQFTEAVQLKNEENESANFVEPEIQTPPRLVEDDFISSPVSADLKEGRAVSECHIYAHEDDDQEKPMNSDCFSEEDVFTAESAVVEPESDNQIQAIDSAEADIVTLQSSSYQTVENLNSKLDELSRKQQADTGSGKVQDFIDIETLMGDADLDVKDEPYSELDLDLGLDEFPDVINRDDTIDIDDDENGIAAQLDLARAYLEIDNKAGAKKILLAVAAHSNQAQRHEIDSLLSRLV